MKEVSDELMEPCLPKGEYVSSIGSSSMYGSYTDIEVMVEEAYFKKFGTDCMALLFAMTHADRMHTIRIAESSAIGAMLRELE